MSRLKLYILQLKNTIIECMLNDNYTALNKMFDDEYSFNRETSNMLLTVIKNIEKICEIRGRY